MLSHCPVENNIVAQNRAYVILPGESGERFRDNVTFQLSLEGAPPTQEMETERGIVRQEKQEQRRAV